MIDEIHMAPENKLKINQQKFFYSNKIAYLYIVMIVTMNIDHEKKVANNLNKNFLMWIIIIIFT